MRRNTPLQIHKSSITAHINKLKSMTNAPSLRPQPIRTSRIDSDDDEYLDDILMNSDSQQSSQSDGEYMREEIQQYAKEKGVSKKIIQGLPKVQVKKGIQGACAICLEEWGQQKVYENSQTVYTKQKNKEKIKTKSMMIILPCAHKFHDQCIEDWLQKRNKCPCCNSFVFL